MSDHIILIFTLSAILSLSPFLSKVTRFPTTVIEVTLGTLAAYVGLLHENTFFEIIAEVGFLYLMFLAGLEINVKEISQSHLKRLFGDLEQLFNVNLQTG